MNYQLNKNGQPAGTFTLEGLRRLRQLGELTGDELVWTGGMAEWQTVDSVLQQASPPALQTNALPPGHKKSGLKTVLVVVLVTCVLLFVIFMGVVGFVAYRTAHSVLGSSGRSDTVTSGESFVEVPAKDAASQPVVVDARSKTRADVQKIAREFRVRQYILGYQLRGERNPECDFLAQQFLTNWVAWYYGGPMDTNLPPVDELAHSLLNNPACQDPLVLSIAAISLGNDREEIAGLERAIKEFDNSKHLAYPKFNATVNLASELAEVQPERVAALENQALQYFKTALADGSIRPEDQAGLAETLVNDWGKMFFYGNPAAAFLAVQEQGEKYQWLALVLQGEYEIAEAWRARGGGYMNTVTDAGWEGFRKHLAAAREKLTAAWQLHPELPLAPCAMIYVSLGNGGIGEMRKWFDRTVAAQIDYAGAWNQMRWGLRPRWYGDFDSMLALGIAAVNTRRFDTDVPRMYFDSVGDIEAEMKLPVGQHIYGRDDIWPHFQELYEGYIAEPSNTPNDRDGWRSAYTTIAFLAGKYDVARQQLEALNWQPHAKNLEGWNRDLSLLPQEVAARTGPQSAQVVDAENRRANGDEPGALQIYQQMASLTNMDSHTRFFVRDRIATLGLKKRLEADDWVDFMPADTNLTGWHVAHGKFSVRPDGVLEVQADQYGHLIYSRVPVGADFEVRGQFEVMNSSSRAFQAGLVMGLPQWEGYNWYSFRMIRNPPDADSVNFSRQWINHQAMEPVPFNDGVNSFDLRYYRGLVTASLNGRDIFKELKPPQDAYVNTNEILLGFGGYNDLNTSVIRYRHVQVRRLLPP